MKSELSSSAKYLQQNGECTNQKHPRDKCGEGEKSGSAQ